MTLTLVLWHGDAVDEDYLKVLLVDPDPALEVTLPFFKHLGPRAEDIGVQLVDTLASEVSDVVVGQVFGGEDKRQPVLYLIEICGGHQDALERVLRGEDDVFVTLAGAVEGDVGDLLVLSVNAVGVFSECVHLHGLAEGVVFASLTEDGLAGGELVDDLLRRGAGGWCGVKRSKAGRLLSLWSWS